MPLAFPILIAGIRYHASNDSLKNLYNVFYDMQRRILTSLQLCSLKREIDEEEN